MTGGLLVCRYSMPLAASSAMFSLRGQSIRMGHCRACRDTEVSVLRWPH